jgi:hypothetical protein
MPIPTNDRRRILLLAAEAAHGTFITTMTGSNGGGFRLEDRRIEIFRETGMAESQGSGGMAAGVTERAWTELTLNAFLVGSGSGSMATLMGLLMPACGFVLSSSTFSRTWAGSNYASLSGGDFRDGLVTYGRGFMGNAVFNFEPGMRCGLEAKMLGGFQADPTDAALPTGMTYQSAAPAIWSPSSGTSGTMLTLDSQTIFRPGKLSIDLGNNYALRENPNSVGGYDGGWITTGASKWTLDPEAYTRATYDFFAKQTGGVGGTITASAVLNGGANKTWTFSMTAQIMSAPKPGQRNGKATEALTLVEIDDSLTIVKS